MAILAAVAVVGALHQLALDSRVRPELAWMWPVVIDGTIVVALLTVLAAKRASVRTGYPWRLAGLFSLASVAFNLAHAPDRLVAQLVFAMAPVALVLTTHLLMQQATWRRQPTQPDRRSAAWPTAPGAGLRPAPAAEAASMTAEASTPPGSRSDRAQPGRDQELSGVRHEAAMTRPHPDPQAAMSGPADLHGRARQVYQEHQAAGRRLSGARLARHIGTSERHGRRLPAEFRAKDEGSTGRNGDRAAPHQQAGPMPR